MQPIDAILDSIFNFVSKDIIFLFFTKYLLNGYTYFNSCG